jgi:cytochrome c oxidase accessory protein FixG
VKRQHAASEGGGLYAKQEKIYPREVTGRFASKRKLAVFVLLGLYYLLPWLSWNGHQAVLFDLPARKFHIFSLTFWPQDFFFLALLLIIAALSLFFFTALAGRLWCGYACPQTVWTEVFLWMEQLAEGKAAQRAKRDRGPWTREKWARKAFKQSLWVSFAAWTGFTFVGYFTPIQDLGTRLLELNLGPWESFWVVFYGFATYGNAGYLREQVCKYMCPYARFQSAMFDRDTLIISYDEGRGEPRGARRRGVEPASVGLGDCIDCTKCVQVCPTGIDIRHGLQYECIACAACVDICDEVMDRMGYPRGLIRYTTQNALEGKARRALRPRTLVYGTLLLTLIGALVTGIALRVPLRLDVIPDRNALYQVVDETHVENVYTLRIMNMDARPHRYRISVGGLADARLVSPELTRSVEGGTVISVPARVRVTTSGLQGLRHSVEFTVTAEDAPMQAHRETRFLTPAGGF